MIYNQNHELTNGVGIELKQDGYASCTFSTESSRCTKPFNFLMIQPDLLGVVNSISSYLHGRKGIGEKLMKIL